MLVILGGAIVAETFKTALQSNCESDLSWLAMIMMIAHMNPTMPTTTHAASRIIPLRGAIR
jgi:hypothetical protein